MNSRAWTAVALGTAAVVVPWWLKRRTGDEGVHASWIIQRSPEEVWDRWRRLDQLPRFLRHIESVEVIDEKRSRWTAVGPGGRRLEWEAEIVEETPGRRLVWCSLPGSEVRHSGEIEVLATNGGAEGRQASVLHASIRAEGGTGGGRIARAQPVTRRALAEDLRRFRSLMEAGEMPRTEGQPTGRRAAADPTNPF